MDGCAVLIVVFLAGVVGFKVFGTGEDTWIDSIFMASITLTTVGFGTVTHVESNTAKIFTSIYSVSGMGVLLYVITTGTAFIVEGEAWQLIWNRRIRKMVEKLDNHFIICGMGRQGMVVAQEFKKTNRPFVMVESNPDRIKELSHLMPDVATIEGDASENQILLDAGIEKSQGLVACLHDDRDNLMLVVTAKQIKPDLRIISKGREVQHITKLSRAGADSIVLPTLIGGMRMASEMIRPSVVTFLDKMLRSKDKTLRVEGVSIDKGASAIGRKLEDLDINEHGGMVVCSIQIPNSDNFIYAPPGKTILEEGMVLVVVGDVNNLPKVEALVV